MKKNISLLFRRFNNHWSSQTGKIMRISLFLLLSCVLSMYAEISYSQKTRLSVMLENKTVQQALDEIEDQSEFFFLYSNKLVNVERRVNLKMEGRTIDSILKELFAGTGTGYVITDRQIILTPDKILRNSKILNPSLYQQQTIKGHVTDKNGKPLVGVTVKVKGKNIGTITDGQGNYEIPVPEDAETLIFSFVGMTTEEVTIGDRTNIDVTMAEELIGIEEVVVVGYSVQRKVNVTGSISTVNLNNVETRPVTQLSQALSGASSGLNVIQNNSQPGRDEATIYIRGLNTLNNTDPLILVDGIVGDLYDVHPNDVESISVLKDASASSIYGARAANGVILITTKRGDVGKMRVSYDYYYGIQKATRLPEVISNSVTYMELQNEAKVNSGMQPLFSEETIEEWRQGDDPILYPNTDWLEYILGDKAGMHSHSFSLNGGAEQARYRISMNYLDQDGIMERTNTDQYTLRTNFDSRVSERLNFGINLSGKWRNRLQPGSMLSILYDNLSTTPMVLPQHPDGRYGGAQTPEEGNVWNAKKAIDTQTQRLISQNMMGKIFASWEILKGLTLNGNAALDLQNWKQKEYETTWKLWNFHTNEVDQVSEDMWLEDYHSMDRAITLYSTLVYNRVLAEKHNLNILAGYSQEYFRTDNFSAYISKFANNQLYQLDAGLNVESQNNSGTAAEWTLRSYFGRLNYNYEEKYLLEANFRYDGSSRFAPENRWGLFPSFSAGWKISEENFMQDVEVINNLKIRASWGEIGNNAIGNYTYLSLYSFNNNYVFNNGVTGGVAVEDMANEEITWESTTTTNAGIDVSLFDNRLEFSGDFFSKKTEDILITLPIPNFIGNLGAPVQNVGIVENKGWEGTLIYRDNMGDFSYNLNLNVSHITNEVVEYSDLDAIVGGFPFRSEGDPPWSLYGGGFLLREGLPVWSLYGYNVIGIFQSQEEVENHAFQNPLTGPGDLKYEDVNDDDVIDGDDRVVLGNPFPKYSYGFSVNMNYKGFDLGALIQGTYKHYGYFQGSLAGEFAADRGLITKKWLDRWTPNNQDTDIPRLGGAPSEAGNNSFWIHDLSYFRLKNIQLGYTIPESLIKNIFIDRIRIYVNADNVFVLSDFESFDPDRGIRQTGYGYPIHRTITFGAGINF